MSPWIGIPPCLDTAGRWRAGRLTHYLDSAYARAVGEAGGVPVLLPQLPSAAEAPARLLERIDGLLLPGGDDFLPPEPHPYPPDVRFAPVAAEQLASDEALLRESLARGLPVLGICYGMQLLARQGGGRLLHHLPLDRPESPVAHDPADREARHPIEIDAGSRLAAMLGTARLEVNSRHHQGVAEPGAGLVACARAGDGLIEAIEAPQGPFVLGVQWHPESLGAAHRGALFGRFVAACRDATQRGPALR